MRHIVIAAALAAAAVSSWARQGVPVVDFVNVPVEAAGTPATDVQVRHAIRDAALAQQWEVEVTGPGMLRLTTVRENFYVIKAQVTYTPSAYSITYLDSEEMNYATSAQKGFWSSNPNEEADAARSQVARYAKFPASKFVVPRQGAVIHPSYEGIVHDLIRGIRAQLRAPD